MKSNELYVNQHATVLSAQKVQDNSLIFPPSKATKIIWPNHPVPLVWTTATTIGDSLLDNQVDCWSIWYFSPFTQVVFSHWIGWVSKDGKRASSRLLTTWFHGLNPLTFGRVDAFAECNQAFQQQSVRSQSKKNSQQMKQLYMWIVSCIARINWSRTPTTVDIGSLSCQLQKAKLLPATLLAAKVLSRSRS